MYDISEFLYYYTKHNDLVLIPSPTITLLQGILSLIAAITENLPDHFEDLTMFSRMRKLSYDDVFGSVLAAAIY